MHSKIHFAWSVTKRKKRIATGQRFLLPVIITARKRSLRRLCFCLSVRTREGAGGGECLPLVLGDVCHTLPPEQTPPAQCMLGYTHTPPVQCMLGYGQQAGGTHLIGMYVCTTQDNLFSKQMINRKGRNM